MSSLLFGFRINYSYISVITVAVYPKDGPVCKTKKRPPFHFFILNNIGIDINSNLK
jgi:hypothetical protein